MTNKIDETRDVTWASRGMNADPVATGDAHANRGADAAGRSDPQAVVSPSKVPGQRVADANPVATGDAQANRSADSKSGGYPVKPLGNHLTAKVPGQTVGTVPADSTTGDGTPSTAKTKSQLMKEAIAHFSNLDQDALAALVTSMEEPEAAPVVDDVARVVSEDMKEVFGSAGLSEEFSGRALIIFEAAVGAKVAARKMELDEEFNVKLEEAVAERQAVMEDLVDKYLSFVAEEWKKENQVALEAGVRGELSESLLSGLKGLLETHYISVPAEKVDALEAVSADLDEANERINNVTKNLIEANEKIAAFERKAIVEELAEGLTIVERDRFTSLVESVNTTDLTDFRSKATIIKESVNTPAASTPAAKVDTLDEEVTLTSTKSGPALVPAYVSPWM